MSGVLLHAITAARTATANSIALMHRTPDGGPHGRMRISCASPRTCEEKEWAESYLAQGRRRRRPAAGVMTVVGLSLQQATARVILLARIVATYHWPNARGRCPRCGVADCLPLRIARDVLQRRSRPPAAILTGDLR